MNTYVICVCNILLQILVNKTVTISPQAGELTVAVSQLCVDDIWQQLREGSSGTSGVKLAASQHCPQVNNLSPQYTPVA